MARWVFVALMAIAAFLMTVVPFYLAPVGFYNGYPLLTTLMPLMILLSGVLAVTGILYYVFQRKTEKELKRSKAGT